MPPSEVRLLNEETLVNFRVLGKPYVAIPSEAEEIARGLLTTIHAASVLFTNIVVSRTTMSKKTNGDIRHELHTYHCAGPISSQQFMHMMRYDTRWSYDKWGEYLQECSKKKISKL